MDPRKTFRDVTADLLREETRGHRRVLMLVSAVALAIVLVPLKPTRLSTLGVDLTADDKQRAILLLLLLVLAYFTAAFVVYGNNDLLVARDARAAGRALHADLSKRVGTMIADYEEKAAQHRGGNPEQQETSGPLLEQLVADIEETASMSGLMSSALLWSGRRLLLDVVVPLLLSLSAGLAILIALMR